ncbi:NAD(P)/FAD-dependent oxidoreductase [Pseudomonas chlororaphis]|uniref:FAD/NAD(P)-dependent oxidoreductase n=1 Tax=Pseudomonas chlororaphis TaxID=587753 RepID=UPI0005AAD265|nr:FAD-dependent oxidoreductase [Pseudomonas chlororaphis]AZD92774.1 Opine oxidase subunit A [Pseudomonas chlororaphis subsp. aureofaciens]KAB0532582.1 NAD(P)-binding protein [Pseudomonas chlororaphis subsp. aureofaciens]WDG57584.1 FAD-dependent oxidoreductase [Pseudomonas chlororaphis]WDG63797.1 FAD-dependent oxidoreductase [Pseudomonas chlororaphis]SDS84056.1 NADPH-dependent 2,4-dienoyl-CoA reductase, sulfur reductase [Pseudomonas chlororaphis]
MATARLNIASGAAPRVVIVGAGPAGVRCAETLLAAGLVPTLVDENRRDGGQIYRRQPEGFRRDYATLYGSEAHKARALHDSFERLRPRIDYRPDTLVWNLTPGQLCCVSQGRHFTLDYDALILCTGATDRLMPLEGWQLAGTYSLGGAQIALKAQSVSIGHRVVFMGSGPLLYLVASQYLKAGAQVAAVLDTSSLGKRIGALPKLLARPGLLWTGMKLLAQLCLARVPVHLGIRPVRVLGDALGGVSLVQVKTAKGDSLDVECDALALGYHLRPETQLADLAGCRLVFDPASSQWLLELDEAGRTSVSGVYAAGDGAKIRGADAAEHAGRLAALALLEDLQLPVNTAERDEQRQALAVMDQFRLGLAQAFPWPSAQAEALPDTAIVCRCEMISAGELRRTVREKGACEVNRAKAFSRVGMGRCQGRYCSQAGAEVIAAAAGVAVQEVGRQRGQAPVKPLSMLTGEVTP